MGLNRESADNSDISVVCEILDEGTQAQLREHLLVSEPAEVHTDYDDMTYDEIAQSLGRWFMIGLIGR